METVTSNYTLQGGYAFAPIGGQTPYATKLACPGNSSSVACATSVGSIGIFDPATCAPVVELKGHSGAVYDIEYFREGHDSLISCGADGTCRIWDVRNGANVRSFQAQQGTQCDTFSCSIGRADQCGAVSKFDELMLFDVGSAKKMHVYTENHMDVVNYVRFHPKKSSMLISGADDMLCCLTDTDIYNEDDCLVCVVNNEDNVRFFSLIGPERNVLVTNSTTETLRVWAFNSFEHHSNGVKCAEMNTVRQHPLLSSEECFGYSVDVFYDAKTERMFVLGGQTNGDMVLLHTNLDEMSSSAVLKGGHTDVVRSALSMDNSIWTCGEDGRVCVWKEAADAPFTLEPNTYAKAKRERAARMSPY